MKLIKKLTTILFAFMMVLAMTGVVLADDRPSQESGVSTTDKGKLTINGALKNEEYTVYRIFDLESYDGDNYSYKVVNEWKDFFSATGEGKVYVTLDTDGYITSNTINTNISDFIQKALKYVATKTISPITAGGTIAVTDTRTTEADGTITYNNLPLGYYLVDSSVGALCSLNTTNLNATINEKNSVPTVQKVVGYSGGGVYAPSNTAEIGQVLSFKTTITVGNGAQNYILHDKMDAGLTYKDSSLKVYIKRTTDTGFAILDSVNYTLPISATDGDTFDITFKQDFLDGLEKNDQIMVEYEATLNEKANVMLDGIAADNNKNITYLTYGDKNTKSIEAETNTLTFTFYINKVNKTDNPLKDAVFAIYREGDTEKVKLVKVNDYDATSSKNLTYRVAKADDVPADIVTEITTPDNGRIDVIGLNQAKYEIEEISAPKGYNKLTNKISADIQTGGVKVNGATPTLGKPTEVKIVNNTGTILPSTGGVGTTMMYIVGAALLIGSGVVLVTKKSAK